MYVKIHNGNPLKLALGGSTVDLSCIGSTDADIVEEAEAGGAHGRVGVERGGGDSAAGAYVCVCVCVCVLCVCMLLRRQKPEEYMEGLE